MARPVGTLLNVPSLGRARKRVRGTTNGNLCTWGAIVFVPLPDPLAAPKG
jgi:hypothetical protein